MDCPKCSQANPESAQFCTRCHATLLFKCPACWHRQTHGGACDKCGVDFAKYAAVVVSQGKVQADQERKRLEQRSSFWKHVFLLPITGGLSLVRELLAKARRG